MIEEKPADMPEDAPAPSRSWENGRLEERYKVSRIDGRPIREDARYFVLQVNGKDDPHAMAAMLAYSNSVRPENPELAMDILRALGDPMHLMPVQHD